MTPAEAPAAPAAKADAIDVKASAAEKKKGELEKADANDYSRFEDISDDSDDEPMPALPGDAPDASMPADERLARADSCKDTGNEKFKAGDLKEALSFYSKGLKVLDAIADLQPPALAEPLKRKHVSLTVSLRLNTAAAANRAEDWATAAKHAAEALALADGADGERFMEAAEKGKAVAKALFRRSVAQARSGALDEAKAGLVRLLKLDRSNKEAAREYARVKRLLGEHKEAQKKQYASVFERASKSGGMYSDKEAQQKRVALQKIEAERKRREEWTAAMAKDGRELSFEEWCEEDDAKRAERRKVEDAEAAARKEVEDGERKKRAAEARKKREEEGGDDVELDEEDLKILEQTKKAGYCYFRTERSEEETKMLAAASAPARLAADAAADADAAAGDGAGAGSGNSAWNANGTTWEERDVTASAKEALTEALRAVAVDTQVEGAAVSVTVCEVASVDGHAQVVVSRKKPAPVYEMSAKVKWSAEHAGAKARGTLHLPDISNGIEAHELEMETAVKKGLDGDAGEAALRTALDALRAQVRDVVAAFVDDLRNK